jgi:hyperosmotically inducible protein
MKKVLLLSLVLAFSAAGVAQTTQASAQSAQVVSSSQAGASEPIFSSNGPVVADYRTPTVPGDPAEAKIAKEVRHELLKLPYYSLFDDVEYSVQGNAVVLSGSVTSLHSQTRQDAERAVKKIEGVEKVSNNIKVLPPNPLDDQARVRVYRALVRSGGLAQYFWEASPSIHIVVDNLHLTLKGYVNNEGSKNLAGITAREVPNFFSVTNDLQVVR